MHIKPRSIRLSSQYLFYLNDPEVRILLQFKRIQFTPENSPPFPRSHKNKAKTLSRHSPRPVVRVQGNGSIRNQRIEIIKTDPPSVRTSPRYTRLRTVVSTLNNRDEISYLREPANYESAPRKNDPAHYTRNN